MTDTVLVLGINLEVGDVVKTWVSRPAEQITALWPYDPAAHPNVMGGEYPTGAKWATFMDGPPLIIDNSAQYEVVKRKELP